MGQIFAAKLSRRSCDGQHLRMRRDVVQGFCLVVCPRDDATLAHNNGTNGYFTFIVGGMSLCQCLLHKLFVLFALFVVCHGSVCFHGCKFTTFFLMCGIKTVFLQHVITKHQNMATHNDFGKWGEDTAVAYLHDQGYTIRERGWRHGKFEIDIIALSPDGVTCVFVEVKTRRSGEVALPSDAVDEKKMRNLGIAADAYVKMFDIHEELRFDVVSIVGLSAGNMQIEHLEDAFNPVLL